MDIFKFPLLLAISFFGLLAANWGVDPAYRFHGFVIALVAFWFFIMALRQVGELPRQANEAGAYCDDVFRAGVIATAFWGMVGFAVGVLIAFQLTFPALNFDWAQPYGNFGRLRPLHTSAVIFAFGGNALITTSFYIVQRTCGVRLWCGKTYWFVFWGYQLFIVWQRQDIFLVPRNRKNMRSLNGMSTFGSRWSGWPISRSISARSCSGASGISMWPIGFC